MLMKSHDELSRIIREGGSVVVGMRVISRLEDLPSAVEIAQSNPSHKDELLAKAKAALEDAQRTIAALEGGVPAEAVAAPQATPEANAGVSGLNFSGPGIQTDLKPQATGLKTEKSAKG